jgi:hypothetical protein
MWSSYGAQSRRTTYTSSVRSPILSPPKMVRHIKERTSRHLHAEIPEGWHIWPVAYYISGLQHVARIDRHGSTVIELQADPLQSLERLCRQHLRRLSDIRLSYHGSYWLLDR